MEHEKLIADAEALCDKLSSVVSSGTNLLEVPAQFKQKADWLAVQWNVNTESTNPPAADSSALFHCAIAKVYTFIANIERFLDLAKDMEACLREPVMDAAWAAYLLERLAWPDGLPEPSLVSRLERELATLRRSE